MKRIIPYSFIALLLFAVSCKKEDKSVFPEPTDVRITEILNAFQQELSGADNGWKVTVFTKIGGGYSFWMKFTEDMRVSMISDFDEQTATELKTSSYRLKAMEQPTLIFDTYNYIHLLADPDGAVSGGIYGSGLQSDFEFFLLENDIKALRDNSAGIMEMNLRGAFNGVSAKFEKATAEEAADYQAGGLDKIRKELSQYLSDNLNLFLQPDGTEKVQVSINPANRTLTLTWLENGSITTVLTPFATLLGGITLKDTLVYNGKQITQFLWDSDAHQLSALVNGDRIPVQVSPTPILPLYLLLGESFKYVLLPAVTDFPGWSDDFKIRKAAVLASFATTGRTVGAMEIDFNVSAGTMSFAAAYLSGTTNYVATYNYTYILTPDGHFTFSLQSTDSNGNLHAFRFDPILAERLNVDTFTIDYYVDATVGVLIQFTDVQHPEFSFSGNMYN